MARSVTPDMLAQAIADELQEYSEEVTTEVKKAVVDVSKEMFNAIQQDAPVKQGDYKKAMALKTEETSYSINKIWHVKSPEYRLAHLLEHGHVKRDGGRVKAYPHIEKNEAKAIDTLSKKIEEAVKGEN